MRKVKKVLIWIGISFIAFCVLSVVVATVFPPDKTEPVKKVVTEQKQTVKKPTVKKPKAKAKVEKPVVKKQVRPEYTAEQVYRFALEYEVREGSDICSNTCSGSYRYEGLRAYSSSC